MSAYTVACVHRSARGPVSSSEGVIPAFSAYAGPRDTEYPGAIVLDVELGDPRTVPGMRVPRRAALVLTLPLLVAPGCASCLSGFEGVTVRVPDGLHTRAATLAVEVCDDEGCASVRERLPRPTGGAAWHDVPVSFGQLGRHFDEGTVEVRAELRTVADRRLVTTREDVELVGERFGGRTCEEFVSGELVVRADPA
jgi:hypothetical protein